MSTTEILPNGLAAMALPVAEEATASAAFVRKWLADDEEFLCEAARVVDAEIEESLARQSRRA